MEEATTGLMIHHHMQQHIERGFIYAAMVFAGAVEALNLIRARRRKAARATD